MTYANQEMKVIIVLSCAGRGGPHTQKSWMKPWHRAPLVLQRLEVLGTNEFSVQKEQKNNVSEKCQEKNLSPTVLSGNRATRIINLHDKNK